MGAFANVACPHGGRRGERLSQGYLPPFFLFLGRIIAHKMDRQKDFFLTLETTFCQGQQKKVEGQGAKAFFTLAQRSSLLAGEEGHCPHYLRTYGYTEQILK